MAAKSQLSMSWRPASAALTSPVHMAVPAAFRNDFLLGLRGILTIQTFLWVFLSLFVPAAVQPINDANQSSGPGYAVILRKVLSVLFWNPSLIYSFTIFLSARCLTIPFLKSSTSTEIASSCFRRGLRLWFPSAVGLAVAWLALSQIGYDTIENFRTQTSNTNVATPLKPENALVYWNSVFDLFWVNKKFATQAASLAFPTQTLWIISIIFQQSYTIYMTLCIIPYTRNAWRVKAMLGFILTAWWVQSWAWYSITALLLADAIANMDFVAVSRKGIPLRFRNHELRVPGWIVYTLMIVAGIVLEYLWTVWKPQWRNSELKGHTGLYNSAGMNEGLDLDQPQARVDNYLIITGTFLLLETYPMLQWVFANPLFTHLGRRSLSYFLITPTIMFSIGIRIFMHLRINKSWAMEPSAGVTFLACLPIGIAFAEVFHWLVDWPTQWMSGWVWKWIQE